MRVFKDTFTGDELFSDSYRFSVVDDIVYEVIGNYIYIDQDNQPCASDHPDCIGNAKNIVVDQSLEATTFDKKSFATYLKMMFRRIKEHLEKTNPERVSAFMAAAQPFAKKCIASFKDLEFYTGASMSPEGVLVIFIHKDIDGEERPCAWVFKDAVEDEKY
ncbi:hypothetical protein GEMRC1_009062 [Eukaryota sp. GEM-RC1]